MFMCPSSVLIEARHSRHRGTHLRQPEQFPAAVHRAEEFDSMPLGMSFEDWLH